MINRNKVPETDIDAVLKTWDQTVFNYFHQLNERGEAPQETSMQLHQLCMDLLLTFVYGENFRDKWSYFEPSISRYGQFAMVRSEKLQTTFSFGIFVTGFYINATLNSESYLCSMDDDFWRMVMDLQSFGKLEFKENVIPENRSENQAKKLMQYNKSQLFRLIRNYIFLETANVSADLGSIEVGWDLETSWDKVILNGREAYRNLYQINYQLYRAEYTALNGHKNRIVEK